MRASNFVVGAAFVLIAVTAASTARAAATGVSVYYTSPRTNELAVTDGTTSRTLATGLTHASGLALGPDGNLYVSEEGGDRIDRLSLTGSRIGSGFGTGRRYTSITFGPDALLYANSCTDTYTNGYVRRFDPLTGQSHGSGVSTSDVAQYSGVNANNYSEGIAFGPDGNVYCPGESTGAISIYQGPAGVHPGATDRSIAGAPAPVFKITFGPDGAAYMGRQDGTIMRYDGTSFTTFTAGHVQLPLGLAFGPGGDLYVADYLGAEIVRFQGPGGSHPGAFIDVFAKTPQNPDDIVVAVPEPGGAIGFLAGVALLTLRRWRRRATASGAVIVAAGLLSLPAEAAVVIEVSDFSGGRVIQTDGTTKTTLISGLNQPMGIAVGLNGDLLVAQQGGAKIGRYKANGQLIGSTFGTGRPYTAMAMGPDGELYVNAVENNYAAGLVERFLPATGAAHKSAQAATSAAAFTSTFTSSYFEGLTFGPDGNVYVAGHYTGDVRVYQGPGGASPGSLIKTLPGVSKPDGLAFGPDGKLYVAEQDLNRVSRWNGSSFSVFVSGSLNTPVGLGFGPDGDLYVSSYSGGNIAHFRGPGASSPGTFVGTFATGIGNPGYILVVPEPSAAVLMILSTGVLELWRRKR